MASRDAVRRLCLLSSCLAVLMAAAQEVQIDFEPMLMGPGPVMMDFDPMAPTEVEGASANAGGRNMLRGPAQNGREAVLDDMLSKALGDMMGAPPLSPMQREGMGSPFGESGVVMIEGPQGTEVINMGGDGGPKGKDPRNSLPAGLLRELFPGPLGPEDAHLLREEGHPQPFMNPDAMIMQMMQDMDSAFTNEVLPAAHKAASQDRVPNSCEQDLKTNCQGSIKSQLHCLGSHADTISNNCKKDVGHSVPFLCSKAIDQFCDVLETGVLDCLSKRMHQLDRKCTDAVKITQHVIKKVNTHKASVVDPTTGGKKVSVPQAKAKSATAVEASLDAKLGLASTAKPKVAEATPAFETKPTNTDLSLISTASPVLSASSSDSQADQNIWRKPMRVLCWLALIGAVAYMFAFTENPLSKTVQKAIYQQQGPEGTKLIDNVELPRPTER